MRRTPCCCKRGKPEKREDSHDWYLEGNEQLQVRNKREERVLDLFLAGICLQSLPIARLSAHCRGHLHDTYDEELLAPSWALPLMLDSNMQACGQYMNMPSEVVNCCSCSRRVALDRWPLETQLLPIRCMVVATMHSPFTCSYTECGTSMVQSDVMSAGWSSANFLCSPPCHMALEREGGNGYGEHNAVQSSCKGCPPITVCKSGCIYILVASSIDCRRSDYAARQPMQCSLIQLHAQSLAHTALHPLVNPIISVTGLHLSLYLVGLALGSSGQLIRLALCSSSQFARLAGDVVTCAAGCSALCFTLELLCLALGCALELLCLS